MSVDYLVSIARQASYSVCIARKLTFNQVKQAFEDAGFELRSASYKNSKRPLAFCCRRCGYNGTTRLEYVKVGNGCPACWEARRGQSSKHALEFVRQKFSVKKLELVESDYPNSKTPLSYRCTECGYVGKLRFNDLSNGAGCRQCGIRRGTSLRRLDFDTFKNDMQKRGIQVRSQEYVNSGTRLQLRCMGCGQVWRATANDLRSAGTGCPRCGHKRGGRKLAHKTEQVSRELAKLGMILLSKYERSQKLIRVRFKVCGHEVERTYNQLSRRAKCPLCAPNARATTEDYHATATMFGGKVLKIASRVSRKSLWRCPLGKHEFERSLESIRTCRTFCTFCTRAYGEMVCRAAVEKLFGKAFRNKRVPGMKSPKGRLLELDIYNDELRIAVEHHGAQHYRVMPHWNGVEGLERQRVHDDLRRQFCRANGILLIEIRELGIRTSLEEMRQQVRDALLQGGRAIPPGFDTADLTRLPQFSASQVYWAEVHEAARKMGLTILIEVFANAETPVTVRCKRGHTTPKTPRSILQGHQCDECYMEQKKKPLQLSDGRVFESGTAAAKVLGVIKETVNTAVRNKWKVRGFTIKRISWGKFRQLSAR
jgi:DNA-directed RNA polymerase subunit RPC12/RpoP